MAEARLAISGTGFIATHLGMSVERDSRFEVARVLTRRDPGSVSGLPNATRSISEALDGVDALVECSGDPVWATEVISRAVEADLPVVTMNTEFHITAGSHFVGRGIVTEAEGDQPGCLAALHEEAVAMGFTPVGYGNMKGFLNPDPSREDMEFWGAKQGISLPMVTSFTDGTKVQAEQVLVGNHFGATISQEGMGGMEWDPVDGLDESASLLAAAYESAGRPVTDFVVGSGLSHGVFIVATHDERQAQALEYYKLGPGPYYNIVRRNIFVHLEILKTVTRVLESGEVLLDNSADPELSLAAVAKRDLARGHTLESPIGSFDVRGHAVRFEDRRDHVPIGLLDGAVLTEDVEAGELITERQVEVGESLATELWSAAKAGAA